MTTGSYDLDTVEEVFDLALKIDLTFKMLVNAKARYSKCKGYGHYDYQCSLESRHVKIVPSDDIDNSKVVEDVYVPSKTAIIIENISVGSDTPIFESHASYKGTSEVVDMIVESGTPLDIEAHAHDVGEFGLN